MKDGENSADGEGAKVSDIFVRAPVPRAALKLMAPTVAGSLVSILYSLADTFFVGRLNDAAQTGAVSLAAPALLAFNAANNLFGVGASSLMSRALGRGDSDGAKKSAAFGFYGALALAAIMSLLCFRAPAALAKILGASGETLGPTVAYMRYAVAFGAIPSILNVVLSYLVRAEGGALHASVGTMSGCVLNIALDPLFISPGGLALGAAGAGLATFLSNCAACAYYFVLLFSRRGKTFVSLDPRRLSHPWRTAAAVMAVGIPVAVQNLLNVTGMALLDNIVSLYGAKAVAAMGIAQRIHTVPVQLALGASQGVMPLVGYSYSSANSARFDETVRFTRSILLPAMTALALALFLFSRPLAGLFIGNDEVARMGGMFLRELSLSLPFLFLDFLAVGVFSSAGLGLRCLMFAVLRKIILEIPAIFILNFSLGAKGVALSAFFAETVLALCGSVMLKKMSDGMKANQK